MRSATSFVITKFIHLVPGEDPAPFMNNGDAEQWTQLSPVKGDRDVGYVFLLAGIPGFTAEYGIDKLVWFEE
jgi:hypothetical protein